MEAERAWCFCSWFILIYVEWEKKLFFKWWDHTTYTLDSPSPSTSTSWWWYGAQRYSASTAVVRVCVRTCVRARARALVARCVAHSRLRCLFWKLGFFLIGIRIRILKKKKKTIGCAASTNWPCDGRLYTKRPVHEAQHPLTIAKEEVRRKKCNPGQCRQHNVVSGRVVAQTVFLLVEAQPLWPKTRGGHCKTREDKPDQTTETSQFPSSPKKDKKNKKTFFFN